MSQAIKEWHWEITRRCNLRCLHCIFGDGGAGPEMGTTEALDAMAHIVELGGESLKVTGGEPLVRDDLSLLIREASLLGLRVEFITNGTMVSERFIDETEDCLSHVSVSLDGVAEINDHIRGKDSFKRAIEAIRLLIARGVSISVTITLTVLSLKSLGWLIVRLKDMGVERFHINDLNLEGRAGQHRQLLEVVWDEGLQNELRAQLEQYLEIEWERAVIDTDCSISPEVVYMTSSGDLYSCTEIMLLQPESKIAHLLDLDIFSSRRGYYEQITPSSSCRYVSYAWPNVSLIMPSGQSCPLIGGGV